MIMNIDTDKMLNELYAMDAPIQINSDWSDEEYHNYIIHMYDVFLIPHGRAHLQDVAAIVYRCRNFRKQVWNKSWSSK